MAPAQDRGIQTAAPEPDILVLPGVRGTREPLRNPTGATYRENGPILCTSHLNGGLEASLRVVERIRGGEVVAAVARRIEYSPIEQPGIADNVEGVGDLILFTGQPDTIVQEPESYPWGLRALIQDPDGRVIELFERTLT